jgi:HSP20 family molecular chaperone IbpA
MADYMTAATLKKMAPGEFSRERDLSFRPDLQSSKAKVDLQLLSVTFLQLPTIYSTNIP